MKRVIAVRHVAARVALILHFYRWHRLPFAVCLALLTVVSGPVGCSEDTVNNSLITLTIVSGDTSPLDDPGTGSRAASPVGSLELAFVTTRGAFTESINLGVDLAPEIAFTTLPTPGSRITIKGYRSADGALYSAGETIPFDPAGNEPAAVSLFLGPVETFVPIGPSLPGPRMGAQAVALGVTGALIVGGYDFSTGARVLAEPALAIYLLGEGRICGADEGCLTGVAPPASMDGIAVALEDGTVLHGLGRTAVGGDELASLFLTDETGVTVELELTGDAISARYGATAVAFGASTALVVGGTDDDTVFDTAYLVDASASAVTLVAETLKDARSFAGASLLDDGSVLVVGGHDGVQGMSSAEIFAPGRLTRKVDGGAFSQARGSLLGPRVAPSLAKLSDSSVMIAGGGISDAEIFRLDLGVSVGGFVNVLAPDTSSDDPRVVSVGHDVLFVGGEGEQQTAPAALVFSPAADQIIGPGQHDYVGEYRTVGWATPSPLRAEVAAVRLADNSVLIVGGGTAGVTAASSTPSSPAQRVELMVPRP